MALSTIRLKHPVPFPIMAFDPGLAAMGGAYVRGTEAKLLTVRIEGADKKRPLSWRIGYMLKEAKALTGFKYELLVIEKMQVYRGGSYSSDLIDLSLLGGALLCEYAPPEGGDVLLPTPREWTGGRPKKVNHNRIAGLLTEGWSSRTSEHSRDALGLALYGAEKSKWQIR